MRRLLLSVLILLVPGAALAQEAGFAAEAAARPGEFVRVGIHQSGASGLAALDCGVAYDGAVLVFQGTEPGPAAPGAMVEGREVHPGRLLVSLIAPEGVSGDGVVAWLRFRVAGAAGAISPLDFTEIAGYDGRTLASIPLRRTTGEVRVGAPGAPPPPAPIPAPPPPATIVPLAPGGAAPPATPAPAGGPSPAYPPVPAPPGPSPAGPGVVPPALPTAPAPAAPAGDDEGGQRFLLILLAFVGVAILFGVFRRRK
ncbi:MAG: hypothetical protein MUE73_12780 [Planctomycetes bacterium]|jgi:hypothetical protein|nr:hypothetical protein [Planctomycetota bacterium]